MNGASALPLSRWMSRASSSLPVPLSPRISTVADSLATLPHQVDDVARQLARSDDELAIALVGDLRAQRHHLAIQILPLARVVHQRANRLVVEVLRGVVVRAELHRLDGGFDVGDRRNHDHFDEAVVLSDDAEHVEAVDAGKAHVEEHQIDVLAIQDGERGFARRRAQHAIVPPEDGVQRVTHPLVIVDDEDRFRLGIHGENSRYCIAFPASARLITASFGAASP